ncbi:unnamed protein product [Prunus armeniaca]|uniref:Uncharacterized protein n=1 Tax=Prunus armeniaca TaxID=36596 RepID=A0A6J5VMD6_PRUAR|nr:unnamed protein product [Prunus armeniaca]
MPNHPAKPTPSVPLPRQSLRPKQPLVWHKDYHMSNQVSHSTSVLCSASGHTEPTSYAQAILDPNGNMP